jgi:hypothetical protein
LCDKTIRTNNINFSAVSRLAVGRHKSPVKSFLPVITSLIFLGLMFSSHLGRSRSKAHERHFELRAESEQFWNLLDRKAQLRKVANGFGFTEGPVWDPAGFLYVSDEEQNKIFKLLLDMS